MPGRTLPTIPQADVEAHNTAISCYVTIGTKVFDITSFLEDHPGGGDLIAEYGGKDVAEIMKDEISHAHSESAFEILDDHLIGFMPTEPVLKSAVDSHHPDRVLPLPPSKEGQKELQMNGVGTELTARPVYSSTGVSSAEDLSVETDPTSDYRTHKFLDLNKPLFMQMMRSNFSKDFYLEQVHRPRHYKGGASAPLFGNFLEPLSKTAWYVVPTLWLPPVMYGTYIACTGLSGGLETAVYWCLGLFLWSLVEYTLHRCLFHLDQ